MQFWDFGGRAKSLRNMCWPSSRMVDHDCITNESSKGCGGPRMQGCRSEAKMRNTGRCSGDVCRVMGIDRRASEYYHGSWSFQLPLTYKLTSAADYCSSTPATRIISAKGQVNWDVCTKLSDGVSLRSTLKFDQRLAPQADW